VTSRNQLLSSEPPGKGTVRNLVFGAIVARVEGEYGDQERHVGSASGGP